MRLVVEIKGEKLGKIASAINASKGGKLNHTDASHAEQRWNGKCQKRQVLRLAPSRGRARESQKIDMTLRVEWNAKGQRARPGWGELYYKSQDEIRRENNGL